MQPDEQPPEENEPASPADQPAAADAGELARQKEAFLRQLTKVQRKQQPRPRQTPPAENNPSTQ